MFVKSKLFFIKFYQIEIIDDNIDNWCDNIDKKILSLNYNSTSYM